MRSPNQADYVMPFEQQQASPRQTSTRLPLDWQTGEAAQILIKEQCYLLNILHAQLIDVTFQAQSLYHELQECTRYAEAERNERMRLEAHIDESARGNVCLSPEIVMEERGLEEGFVCFTPASTESGFVGHGGEEKISGIFTFGELPAPKVQELRERIEGSAARAVYSPYHDYLGSLPSQGIIQARTCQPSQVGAEEEKEEKDLAGFEKQMEGLVITDPFHVPFGLINKIHALKRVKLGFEETGLHHQRWVFKKRNMQWPPQRRHKGCACQRDSPR